MTQLPTKVWKPPPDTGLGRRSSSWSTHPAWRGMAPGGASMSDLGHIIRTRRWPSPSPPLLSLISPHPQEASGCHTAILSRFKTLPAHECLCAYKPVYVHMSEEVSQQRRKSFSLWWTRKGFLLNDRKQFITFYSFLHVVRKLVRFWAGAGGRTRLTYNHLTCGR